VKSFQSSSFKKISPNPSPIKILQIYMLGLKSKPEEIFPIEKAKMFSLESSCQPVSQEGIDIPE